MTIHSKILGIITSLAIGLLTSSGVSAFTLNSDLGPLDIDFRTNDWMPAHGATHYTTGGVRVIAYNSISVPVTTEPTPGQLFWENDGFGVSGGAQDDEIDGPQGIVVTAAPPSLSLTGTTLTRTLPQPIPSITAVGVWLNDFFATTGSIAETGRLSFFNLGSNTPFKVIDFTSDVPNLPGSDDYAFYLDFGGPVSFGAALFTTPNGDRSEYAVAGFDTAAPVPVPPAIWLMGSAVIFLFRKRKG